MKTSVFAAGLALIATALPAQAATYTYEINYNFPILRDALLGAPAKPRAGKGSLSGTLTFDDAISTNGQLVSFNLTTVNTTTGFTQQNSYSYSSSDLLDTATHAAPTSVWDAYQTFTFRNPSSAVPCSDGNVAPSGQHAGRQYCVNPSVLRIYVNRAFTAGDATFSMIAQETFGIAPLRYSNGYADLGFEHTAPRNGAVLAGTLVATDDDAGNDMSPVPLPAGLPLLLAGLGALGIMGRRTSQDT